jgi:pantothenate kinase
MRALTRKSIPPRKKNHQKKQVDMLVGDIYGGRDYPAIGLSASTIACSFGKVVSGEGDLADYAPADVAMALCRMVAYNIAQLAYLNAR